MDGGQGSSVSCGSYCHHRSMLAYRQGWLFPSPRTPPVQAGRIWSCNHGTPLSNTARMAQLWPNRHATHSCMISVGQESSCPLKIISRTYSDGRFRGSPPLCRAKLKHGTSRFPVSRQFHRKSGPPFRSPFHDLPTENMEDEKNFPMDIS